MLDTDVRKSIRVGLIDDHQIVHVAMQGLLKGVKDINLVSSAYTARTGLQMLREFEMDVLLLDLSLPDVSGLQFASRLTKCYKKLNLVVLSSSHHLFFVEHLIRLGVRGYVTKSSDPNELITAIRLAYQKKCFLSEDIVAKLTLLDPQEKQSASLLLLTTLEKSIMLKLIRGYSFKHISEILCLSMKTVYDYRERIFQKLKVKNKVELLLLAIDHDLMDADRFK